MKELADAVWHVKCLPGYPAYGVNAFLLGDVLVDAGTRQSTGRILRQLEGREVNAHALTHAHPDHQGACPEADIAAAEDPNLIRERQPDNFMAVFFWRIFQGPAHKVDRPLKKGDEVAGFRVIDVPGHSAGHVAFWRESDRVLFLGDVLTNMDQYTLIPGLREPKTALTPDPKRNRESARKLGALEPDLVCFGHGAPLRDRRKFVDFVAGLPD
jgi:glyoxylase-like metal-dependent hydrolase (beta-lactamase superfamily II)